MFRMIMTILTLGLTFPVYAEENPAIYHYKSMSVEMASKAARHAMLDCRKRGYSVAVAVVDRGGNLQAFYRDRFAGPHTVETAMQKAWTANSFRQNTSVLANLLKQGRIPNQVQHNPGALLVGGGVTVQAAGELIGSIGVSGAPPGKSEIDSIDGACAKAGILAVSDEIEFN